MTDDRKDLEIIEEALGVLFRAGFQHKTWETLRQSSGVQLERADVALLKAIIHCPSKHCRMQDIANYLGIEAPSVTRKVQELEQLGYVARQTDPEDKRASLVTITQDGIASMKKLQKARIEQLAQVMADWSEEERAEFARLFNKLAQDLKTK
jgi:DNA-binding MarR family transcriptional regulator